MPWKSLCWPACVRRPTHKPQCSPTRHLRIVPSSLGPEAALHGATLLGLDLAYDSAIELVEDREATGALKHAHVEPQTTNMKYNQ